MVDNAEYLFGPSSIYLPKSLISTSDGAGTIPDGFVIDLENRIWYLVEAETSKHSVWSHIAPQVAKQIIAAINPVSKQLLVNIAVERVQHDEELLEKFKEQGIPTINIRKVLDEIVANDPIVAMPIDAVKNDLRDWAATVRIPVKLWIVRKYVEFGRSSNVMYEIPEEFGPVFDTKQSEPESFQEKAKFDVTISDLLAAGLLHAGQKLSMPYKPKNGEPRKYTATIRGDGSLELMGQHFGSPSYAALYGIQDAGSGRKTINGWTAWRLESGEFIGELREKYLLNKPDTEAPSQSS